jgi:NitT/TauT family transport system permease protein
VKADKTSGASGRREVLLLTYLAQRPGERAARRFGVALTRMTAAWAVFLLALALWWLLTKVGGVQRFFLPPPDDTLNVGVAMVQTAGFWLDLAFSVWRICGGFVLAAVTAIPCGILMGRSRVFSALMVPPISFIRFVPMPAVIPLMILWFGSAEWGKLMIICLGVFFQLVLMIADAVARVPRAYEDIAHSLGVTVWQRLRSFVVPAAAPEIWDSLRINFGLAWTILIFAEILGATSGLGYLIVRSQRFLLTEQIFVAVLAIGLLGVMADMVFERCFDRWFAWSEQAQKSEVGA